VAEFGRVHCLVTDAPPPPEIADAIAQAGVELVLAPG